MRLTALDFDLTAAIVAPVLYSTSPSYYMLAQSSMSQIFTSMNLYSQLFKMSLSLISVCLNFMLLISQASTQLIGPVGPRTPLREKTHLCNIFDFGGVADNSTDVAIAITTAFEKCILGHSGSRLVVPEGNYLLKQSIVLSNGTNWAWQLDGLITAEYVGNESGTSNYLVPRDLILQGFAGVEALNSTINGEGDGRFLENLIVIVNGLFPDMILDL